MSLRLPPNTLIRPTVHEYLYSLHASRDQAGEQAHSNALSEAFCDQTFHDIRKQEERPAEADCGKVYELDSVPRWPEAIDEVAANVVCSFNPVENGQPSSTDVNWEKNHAACNIPFLIETERGSWIKLQLEEILKHWVNQEKPGENRSEAACCIIHFSGDPKKRTITLDNFNLTSLPDIFDKRPFGWKLFSLFLPNNRLTSFPKHIGQLQRLMFLNLSNNHLKSFPEDIGQLKSLTFLDLSDNQLTTVPGEIDQLEHLKYLDLLNNHLTSLPEQIGKLKNLITLHLSQNCLESLPMEIGQLKKLTFLSLEDNFMLKSLPEGVHHLDQSCSVYIKGIGVSKSVGTNLEQSSHTAGYQGPKIVFSSTVEDLALPTGEITVRKRLA